jgi:rod shape-determining protein MreD
MIRVIALSTLILSVCSIAQSTWFSAIAVLGVAPDLGLVVLLWLSYKNGSVEGPCSGFLAGLIEDFLSAAPLGYNAFLKTSVASLTSLLHGSFAIDRVFLPILLGFSGTIAKALSAGLLSLFFGGKLLAYSFITIPLWIEAAYNALIAPIVFALLSILKKALVTRRGRE